MVYDAVDVAYDAVNFRSGNYLNQCWLLICEALWHSAENKISVTAQDINLYGEFENHIS